MRYYPPQSAARTRLPPPPVIPGTVARAMIGQAVRQTRPGGADNRPGILPCGRAVHAVATPAHHAAGLTLAMRSPVRGEDRAAAGILAGCQPIGATIGRGIMPAGIVAPDKASARREGRDTSGQAQGDCGGILDGWRGECGARHRHPRNPIVAFCCFARPGRGRNGKTQGKAQDTPERPANRALLGF